MTATERAAQKGDQQIHEVAPDNVAFRWQIGDAAATEAAFKKARRRRQEAHRQPAASGQCHGAAGLRGALRGLYRRPHPLGDLAEPPRDRLLMTAFVLHPRAQGAGHRPRRGGRLRVEDLPLQRGNRLLLGDQADQAAHPLDVEPARGLPDRRPRARSHHGRRGRALARRQIPGAAREDHREPGRVPLDLRACGAHLPLRDAAQRRVHVRCHSLRGDRRLHQHHAGGRLPRAGRAGGVLSPRADGGRGRGRAQDGPGRHPEEELHPEVRQRVPDQGGADLRQRQLRGGLRPRAPDAGLQEVPGREAEARAKGRLIGVGFSTYIEACSIAPSKVVGSLGARRVSGNRARSACTPPAW